MWAKHANVSQGLIRAWTDERLRSTSRHRLRPHVVLFLCTGNYYRSRFAEVLFNHLARERGLRWRAESRGLDLAIGVNNVGPISPHTPPRV